MTGFEYIVLGAFFCLAMILRAESKAADRQHEELVRRIDALQGWIKADLEVKGRMLARLGRE